MLAFLSDAERADETRRRDGAVFEARLKARGALRCILSACTNQAAPRIAIATGSNGKPELAFNPHGLSFNASRSGDYAVIGLGRAPLGIDIEAIQFEFDWRVVAEHWLHPRERALLAATPKALQAEAFFQIWTHKEAYVKGVGAGLDREAMTSTYVTPDGRSIRGLRDGRPRDWRLTTLDAPPGYKASLASANASPIVVDRTDSFAKLAGSES